MDATEEGRILGEIVRASIPRVMPGRKTVMYLKEHSPHWKQTEWIGWAVEAYTKESLAEAGFNPGPRIGSTPFDLKREFVWDLKTHNASGRGLILNDVSATDECIRTHSGIGAAIVAGDITPDSDGSFHKWHQALAGGPTAYSIAREARGAPARRRKAAFRVSQIVIVRIASAAELETARGANLIGLYRQGRNSNGQPRPPKYMIRSLAAIAESPFCVFRWEAQEE